jgi:hypothetical protein
MPDITAIAQGFGALKALKDIGEAMIGVANVAAFRERQIEFQQRIIDAQNAIFTMQEEHSALISKVGELEEKITHLKAWDAEKERYKLTEVGLGAFAYVVKPEMQGSEPEHLICPTCYERANKSILQVLPQFENHATGADTRVCPICNTRVAVAQQRQWKAPTERRWD